MRRHQDANLPSDMNRRAEHSSSTTSTGHSATASSSSTSSSSAAAATATTIQKSSSSYVILDLPDAFEQCEPATVDFNLIIGSKDVDLLGDSRAEAQENTWLELAIWKSSASKAHLREVFPSNQTEWTWPAVDLPAGTVFSLIVSAVTNQTLTNATSKDAATKSHKSQSKRATKSKDESQVLAHSLARSNVVAANNASTSCLSSSNNTASAGNSTDGAGSSDGDADDSPNVPGSGSHHHSDNATIIIAAFMGGLVGLFIALLAALGFHRHREAKRLRAMHANGSATSLNALPGDRQHVQLWDGRYGTSPSAGWSYMSRLVPGLNPGDPPSFVSPNSSPVEGNFAGIRGRRRGNGFMTSRRREEGDDELPSYGKSEEEIKGLPRYEPGTGLRHLLSTGQITRDNNRPGEHSSEHICRRKACESPLDPRNCTPSLTQCCPPSFTDHMSPRDQDYQHSADRAMEQPMSTVLTYLPSGPSRPFSTLETSQVPSAMRSPAAAEISSSVTVTSIDRRANAHALAASQHRERQLYAGERPDSSGSSTFDWRPHTRERSGESYPIHDAGPDSQQAPLLSRRDSDDSVDGPSLHPEPSRTRAGRQIVSTNSANSQWSQESG